MLGLAKASTLAAAQEEIARLSAELEAMTSARDRAISDGVRDVRVWTDRCTAANTTAANAERRAGELVAAAELAASRAKQDRAAILAAANRDAEAAKLAAAEREAAHADAMIAAHETEVQLRKSIAAERAANDALRAELVEMRKASEVAISTASAARTEADAVAANLRRQAQEHAEQLAASNKAHRAEAGALRREIDSLRASR